MWNNITINSNCVQENTGKAILVKVPKQEWLVWIPLKLAKFSGKNDYLCKLSINDEFEYSLFKNGKGKYNKFEKIAEKKMMGSDFKYELGFKDSEEEEE